MGIAKSEARADARVLRHHGWSMRRIAVELDVSISSVSLWVRDIQLPEGSGGAPTIVPRPDKRGTRRCGKCERRLPLTCFNRSGEGHQWWCRECFGTYFRERGDLHREQSGAARRRRRDEGRTAVDEHLAQNPCADCGESDPVLLEFDHLGPKRGDLSVLRRNGFSTEVLREEFRQCEAVCVNCHRRRTARRDGSWRLKPKSLDTDGILLRGERRNMQCVRDLLMSARCIDCGLADLLALEFDHTSDKDANVPAIARRGCSLARLKREIERCQIRCANCHRRRTIAAIRGQTGCS